MSNSWPVAHDATFAPGDYEVRIDVRGPEGEPNQHGTRHRETLASLEVPAFAATAWQVYAQALAALTDYRPLIVPVDTGVR
jgi:hypothetical protein